MPITNTTRIIDLPTKSSLGSGDYFAVDNENGDTSKILATSVSGSSTAGLVAEEYSNSQTYDKGDYCIHVENNVPKLYRANQDISTAETWTAAHWDPTDAGSELTTANADIEALNQNLTECVKKKTTADITVPTATGRTIAQSLNILINSTKWDISKVNAFSYIKIGVAYYRVSSVTASRAVFTYDAVSSANYTSVSLYAQAGANYAYTYNGSTVTSTGGDTLSNDLEFYY